MTAVDPGVEGLMRLSSELLRSQDVVRTQQKQLWALMSVLKLEQQRSAALCDLVDTLLGDD